ncbi:LysM peptidoglycan-binding domain-containing protein [Aurantivibrio infirmus]
MIKSTTLFLLTAVSLIGCSSIHTSLTEDVSENTEQNSDNANVVIADVEWPAPNYDLPLEIEEPAAEKPEVGDIWKRIREGFQISQIDHPRIENYRNWYSSNPSYMNRVSERASRYMYGIVEKLDSRGMPLELALLPIVESAFDPFAYSHATASGMWQFMPATGKQYGLKQNYWYDGRRDIEAATNAAIEYLDDLQKSFDGDWLLALAAYNSGAGNVRRAIRRNKRAGKPTDFWSLRLPRETQAYVPQLLALTHLVANPEKYKTTLTPIPNQATYVVVDVDSQIDLAKAAELADISIDDFYLFNPGFSRWATDPDGPHSLLIPVEKADVFTSNLAQYPQDQRVAWDNYKVVSGDSLNRISKRFNTSVDTIKSVNGLRNNLIRVGQQLLIPKATQSADHYVFSAEQRVARKQNQSSGKQGSKKIVHVVTNGDSFWKISRKYNVSVNQLTRWNGLAPRDILKLGQELVVWTSKPVELSAQQRQGNKFIRTIAYQVRRGDSLARIADKFNLSVADIVQWNSINVKKYLQPGQRLKLKVDVTRTN